MAPPRPTAATASGEPTKSRNENNNKNKNKNNNLTSRVEKHGSKPSSATRISLPGAELYERLVAEGILKDPSGPERPHGPKPPPEMPSPEMPSASARRHTPPSRAESGYRRLWNQRTAAWSSLVSSTPDLTTMRQIKERHAAVTTYPHTCIDGIILDSPDSIMFPTKTMANGLYEWADGVRFRVFNHHVLYWDFPAQRGHTN
ncbi:hypothetical protein MBLNU459_g6720t1 [Dothideomycetes sp. NU459]